MQRIFPRSWNVSEGMAAYFHCLSKTNSEWYSLATTYASVVGDNYLAFNAVLKEDIHDYYCYGQDESTLNYFIDKVRMIVQPGRCV